MLPTLYDMLYRSFEHLPQENAFCVFFSHSFKLCRYFYTHNDDDQGYQCIYLLVVEILTPEGLKSTHCSQSEERIN